jgi:hypothetical protein
MLIGRAADSLSGMLNDRAFRCSSAVVHAGPIRGAAEAVHVAALSRGPPEVRLALERSLERRFR